ncbi:MAG: type I methionyl aminopeptidase [Bacteroidales bacterium]|nr:type I methionyl aminopeptidase [Bacteroidales bacterium]
MINIRTAEEIEIIRECNLLVSKTLGLLKKHIKPGVKTVELDKIAEEFIRDNNAEPGFLGYQGYPKTLCTSVNNQVVHGIPSDYVLAEGDIVSIDCGVKKNGYYGDTAYSFAVGAIGTDKERLLRITRESLFEGIKVALPGNRTGDIGFAVQQYCENAGYSVVRELVGHGLGKNLHEAPEVPNYGKRGKGHKLAEGMVICIEPMINMGRKEVIQEKDGWTIRTRDKMPSAHFELAIAIQKGAPDILSTFKYIEEE